MAVARLAAALLAAALLTGWGVARAAAPGCPAGPVRLRVTIVDPPAELSTTGDLAALRDAAGPSPGATLRHLALTASRVEWRGEIETRDRTLPGGVCATPAAVTLALVQTEHRIRIAREIPRGSCLFRALEAHERRHVAVNQATLRQAAGQARQAAAAWASQAEGHGATAEAAAAALQQGLRQAIAPALDRLREARDLAHGAIDSDAEYARLGRICPADQQRLRPALRALPPR